MNFMHSLKMVWCIELLLIKMLADHDDERQDIEYISRDKSMGKL